MGVDVAFFLAIQDPLLTVSDEPVAIFVLQIFLGRNWSKLTPFRGKITFPYCMSR